METCQPQGNRRGVRQQLLHPFADNVLGEVPHLAVLKVGVKSMA